MIWDQLIGKLVTLREMKNADLNLIHDWENRSELWYLGDVHEPLSTDEVQKFINRSTGDIYLDGQLRLMIEANDQTVGCIDLFDFDKHNHRAGMGILIAEMENRKQGYASESIQLLTKYCFDVLNFKQLYCHITVDNEASLKLFSNCGFSESGRNKDWVKKGNGFIDAVFMQKLNG